MFDTWQEHCDHELFAAHDDVLERYGSSAIDHATEAAMDAAATLDRAATRLRADAVAAKAGGSSGMRVVWSAPAGPGLVGLWAQRVDVPAEVLAVDGARVLIRPDGTVYRHGKGYVKERARWVDARRVRSA